MIIYPPFIAETIPSFIKTELIIPFQQNPAVDMKTVSGFKVMIKEYSSSKNIAYSTVDLTVDKEALDYNEHTKIGKIKFTNFKDLNDEPWEPTETQYYKFQICYLDGEEEKEYYSNVSIGRCIASTSLSFKDLNDSVIENPGIYTGEVVESGEELYSYSYVFYQGDSILQETGEILFNSAKKEISSFILQYDLESGKNYSITFSITTINGYQASISADVIANTDSYNYPFYVKADQDEDASKSNGYVVLSLKSKEDMEFNDTDNGFYFIERAELDNSKWTRLISFEIKNKIIPRIVWRDHSVEQGITYKYAIKKNSVNANRETSEYGIIAVDFEDIFLSDNQKQLKIKFNPKISTFKRTILEQKTDTIGSKYPFFFRNGQVDYKEIALSGLISYFMDDNEMFITNKELGLDANDFVRTSTISNKVEPNKKTRTTQLVGYNYTAERKFRLELLNWLTNGEPKLFRSPSEGNYIIRLMNVNLTPVDSTGGLLYSFSATGYEISDNDIENLINKDLANPTSVLGYFVLTKVLLSKEGVSEWIPVY